MSQRPMSNKISKYLQDFIPVTFALETAEEFQVIGSGPVQFKVTVNRQPSRRELMRSTSLALGEAYMRGDIELDRDLYEVLDLFLGEIGHFKRNEHALKGLYRKPGDAKRQQREIASHYDIGNEFYKMWLDETMNYSCGYFADPNATLFEAQVAKTDHILEKLQLEPGMRLLDIGCGWGFLIKRAVEHYGVSALGITLSEEQYAKANAEIHDQHLEGRLSVRLMDYRALAAQNERFDRVVSVGMLEHVGRGNYGEYLSQVQQVLKPGGLFLLHFISALQEHSGDPWIRKYIFPGGVIPSLREIIQLLPDYNFYTLDVESLRRHYTRTLQCWRENFKEHQAEIELDYGTEFARMWELYLAACAAAFHHGVVDLHQLLLSKGVNNSLPMTRVV